MRVSMLSFVAAGALVLAMVLHGDEIQEPDPVPPSGMVTHVTGALDFPTGGTGGAGTLGEHALQWRGVAVDARLSTNDPRLSGELRLAWNCDVFRPDWVHETSGAVATGAVVLRNERGTWEGVWRGLTYPGHAGFDHHVLLSGEGGYRGRSALLYITGTPDHDHLMVEGLVFPGEMPPCPELHAQ